MAAVDVDVEGFEFVGVAAAAYAQLEAAAADGVDDGGVFGHAQGVFEGEDDDRRAQAQPARTRGDGGQEWEGGGQVAVDILEVVLGDPAGVEAELVGGLEDAEALAVGLVGVGSAAQVAHKPESKWFFHRLDPAFGDLLPGCSIHIAAADDDRHAPARHALSLLQEAGHGDAGRAFDAFAGIIVDETHGLRNFLFARGQPLVDVFAAEVEGDGILFDAAGAAVGKSGQAVFFLDDAAGAD